MEFIYAISTSNTFRPNPARRLSRGIKLRFAGLALLATLNLQAEGTKQLAPNADEIVMLLVNNNTYGNFAAYDGPEQSSGSMIRVKLFIWGFSGIFGQMANRNRPVPITSGSIAAATEWWFTARSPCTPSTKM